MDEIEGFWQLVFQDEALIGRTWEGNSEMRGFCQRANDEIQGAELGSNAD